MKVGKKASSGSFLRNPRSRCFSLLCTMLVGHDMHEFVMVPGKKNMENMC